MNEQVIYVKPGSEADLDSLVRDAIRLAVTANQVKQKFHRKRYEDVMILIMLQCYSGCLLGGLRKILSEMELYASISLFHVIYEVRFHSVISSADVEEKRETYDRRWARLLEIRDVFPG